MEMTNLFSGGGLVKFLIRLFICGLVIFLIAYLFPSLIKVDSFKTALLAALVLAVINALVRPIVLLLTLPINFLTLGLFTFLVNAFTLWLVSLIVPGFELIGILQTIVASFLISLISSLLSKLVAKD